MIQHEFCLTTEEIHALNNHGKSDKAISAGVLKTRYDTCAMPFFITGYQHDDLATELLQLSNLHVALRLEPIFLQEGETVESVL